MYKRNNMLREKRKHANYKPNRRLDAKSSRGMIYENEELRIRTININADVERGQSEIKTLKREREQLRREIWTLRDEYDKLEHLLRTKGIDPDEFLNQNKNSNNNNNNGDDAESDENLSDCSECSCESCCGGEDDEGKASNDNQSSEKTDEASSDHLKSEAGGASTSKGESQQSNADKNVDEHNKRSGKDRLNLNFDHLSVVSEENSEVNSNIQNEDSSIPIHDLSAFLHDVDVLSPLNYLQTLCPPLAHFENLNYDQIGGSVDQQGNITAMVERNVLQSNGAPVVISRNTNKHVPSTSSTSEPVKKESRLKHFFSPIKKKHAAPLPPVITSQPDVYISNVLPSNMYVNPLMQLQNSHHTQNAPKPDPVTPTSSFQNGGNLEELLYDIEALSKDIMDLQTQCSNSPTETVPINKKPYRSELNLFLSYPNPPTDNDSTQITPPVPAPMELMTPSSQTNPLLLQNLPSPFPSPSIPSSPLTPPTSFNTTDANLFDNVQDYSHLDFPPINAPVPNFSSNNSIFCTVSAPSTPASDRKCIDKFCTNEAVNDSPKGSDKKKSKRVSIFNTSKDENNEKPPESPDTSLLKDGEAVKQGTEGSNGSSHHNHRNHSHGHIHPKRRMSLDNTMNSAKHRNHRQICQDPNARVQRRESNRSSNSFKKRSRSDSAFGVHGDDQGGTSMSERYSNSIASSRESSTSLSMKSGKRRISITSYGGSKKIPWCGCWGNSCL